MSGKRVYFFGDGQADGNAGMKELLGGKGANLAEMVSLGIPVPPGFTVTTAECIAYQDSHELSAALQDDVRAALAKVEKIMDKKFADAADPLLFSVRSGARVSMPGMMDTVLNLGLNDDTVQGLAAKSGNERFAYDSYRRLVQMYGDVVMGVDGEKFEHAIDALKAKQGVKLDTELSVDDLKELIATFKDIVADAAGKPFPSRSLGAAVGRHHRRLRELERGPGQGVPPHPRASPRTGAPRSTSRPWSSATWARPRPPAWPSPAIPPRARSTSTASS